MGDPWFRVEFKVWSLGSKPLISSRRGSKWFVGHNLPLLRYWLVSSRDLRCVSCTLESKLVGLEWIYGVWSRSCPLSFTWRWFLSVTDIIHKWHYGYSTHVFVFYYDYPITFLNLWSTNIQRLDCDKSYVENVNKVSTHTSSRLPSTYIPSLS